MERTRRLHVRWPATNLNRVGTSNSERLCSGKPFTVTALAQRRRNEEEVKMKWSLGCAAFVAITSAAVAAQPAWKPEKQVEVVLPTAPGGGNDAVARLMAKVLQEQKLV